MADCPHITLYELSGFNANGDVGKSTPMYTGGDLDFETPTVQCSGRKFLSFGFNQSFMRYENSPYHSNFLRFLGILPFIKCKQSFEVISQANNQQKLVKDNCHTRLHLGFSTKLRIWHVPAYMMELQSGIIS